MHSLDVAVFVTSVEEVNIKLETLQHFIWKSQMNFSCMIIEQPNMHPFPENLTKTLERFLIVLYDRTSEMHWVDEAIQHVFAYVAVGRRGFILNTDCRAYTVKS